MMLDSYLLSGPANMISDDGMGAAVEHQEGTRLSTLVKIHFCRPHDPTKPTLAIMVKPAYKYGTGKVQIWNLHRMHFGC